MNYYYIIINVWVFCSYIRSLSSGNLIVQALIKDLSIIKVTFKETL